MHKDVINTPLGVLMEHMNFTSAAAASKHGSPSRTTDGVTMRNIPCFFLLRHLLTSVESRPQLNSDLVSGATETQHGGPPQ